MGKQLVVKGADFSLVAVGDAVIAPPEFTVAEGSYYVKKTIGITVPAGSTVYYTTDGSTPTAASLEYSAPFLITNTCTVNAIAVKNGITSEVVSATYTILPTPWQTGFYGPTGSLATTPTPFATYWRCTKDPIFAGSGTSLRITIKAGFAIRLLFADDANKTNIIRTDPYGSATQDVTIDINTNNPGHAEYMWINVSTYSCVNSNGGSIAYTAPTSAELAQIEAMEIAWWEDVS